MHSTSGRRARRMAAVVVACLSGTISAPAPGALAAQVFAGTRPSGWLIGGSIGVPAYAGELAPELLTLGAQWTHVRANRPGADFALGTLPRTLGFGILSVGMRGGVALPLLLAPGVMLLPSTGVSVLGGIGSFGGVGTAGYNFGLSAVYIPPREALAIRAGATRHTFGSDGSVWLLEIGVSRAPGRR